MIQFKHGIIILVLVLVFLTCLLVFHKYHNMEHYQDRIVPAYVDAVYKDQGIEPCSILASSNYMATNYIDSLRIRKWKPRENDSDFVKYAKSQPGSDYCYFFMDSDKRLLKTNDNPGYAPIMDPLSTFSNCSKENTIFRAPVVTNVFESTGFDKTHNLPYKKCVLELNRDLATESNVNTFWDGFSGANNNAFCQGMANALQIEIASYKSRIASFLKQINPFRGKYTSTDNLKTILDECHVENKRLDNQLHEGKANLANLQKEINTENDKYSLVIAGARKQLTDINEALKLGESELTTLTNNNRYILDVDLDQVQKDIINYTRLRDACFSEFTNVTDQYDQLFAKHSDLTQVYRQLTMDLGNCEKLVRELNANIEENKPVKAEFEQKLIDIKDALFKCTTEQSRLLKEEDFWKSKMKQVTDDLTKCMQTRATLEAEIESLKSQKEAFIREIEEIKRRCRDDQSQFNMATVTMHREASKEIIATEQQRCSASIAMRKRRTELLNELNGILLQANSCDRVVASCRCYKRMAEFGWNDEGLTSPIRATTTSGRIVEVRKNLVAAPFIQFVGNRKSAILRITRTRKKKGSGSYIEVAGAINVNGIRSVIMYSQI